MLKAVTFDLWNTVIKAKADSSIGDVLNKRIQDILAKRGVEKSMSEINEVVFRCRDTVMDLQVHEGKEMPPNEQVDWIIKEFGIEADEQFVAELYEAYTTVALAGAMPEPIPGVAELLGELGKIVDVALICNTGRTPGTVARQILERLGLKHYFNHFIFSDEAGAAKPNPDIFYAALSALGVKPEEVVHIGDDPRTDVKGARNVGIKTAWLPVGEQQEEVECDIVVRDWDGFLAWVKERA